MRKSRANKRTKDEIDFKNTDEIPSVFLLKACDDYLNEGIVSLYLCSERRTKMYLIKRVYKCVSHCDKTIGKQEYYTVYTRVYKCVNGPSKGQYMTTGEKLNIPTGVNQECYYRMKPDGYQQRSVLVWL